MDRVWKLNSKLDEEWGDRRGLRSQKLLFGNYSLNGLVRKGTHEEVLRELREEYELSLLDHARHYKVKNGADSIAVIVTAPYLRATLGAFGTPAAANAKIHEFARELGLNVRVGHPKDTIYLSNNDDDPTLPIVWWNPTRFHVPFPEIDDPNPRYASRMETK